MDETKIKNDDDNGIPVLKSEGVGDPTFKYYIWEEGNIKSLLEAIEMDLEYIDDAKDQTITITISRAFMSRKELDELQET